MVCFALNMAWVALFLYLAPKPYTLTDMFIGIGGIIFITGGFYWVERKTEPGVLSNLLAVGLAKEITKKGIEESFDLIKTVKANHRDLRELDDKTAGELTTEFMMARVRQMDNESAVNMMRALAETSLTNATTEQAKERVKIIRNAADNIDFNKMPPDLQSFVISSVINPNISGMDNYELITKLEEAKLKMETAKAEQEQSKADVSKATAKKTIDEINQLRNKP